MCSPAAYPSCNLADLPPIAPQEAPDFSAVAVVELTPAPPVRKAQDRGGLRLGWGIAAKHEAEETHWIQEGTL